MTTTTSTGAMPVSHLILRHLHVALHRLDMARRTGVSRSRALAGGEPERPMTPGSVTLERFNAAADAVLAAMNEPVQPAFLSTEIVETLAEIYVRAAHEGSLHLFAPTPALVHAFLDVAVERHHLNPPSWPPPALAS